MNQADPPPAPSPATPKAVETVGHEHTAERSAHGRPPLDRQVQFTQVYYISYNMLA